MNDRRGRQRARAAWTALALVSLAGLSAVGPGSPDASADEGPASAFAAERRACVDITNRYRATVGAAPLTPSPELEAYAAAAARHDGLAHRPHAYFEKSDGGDVALAENLVPWWSLARWGSLAAVVENGLALMWNEGPRGVHRRNMEGPYAQVGCGLFVNGDEVTLIQAFR